MSKICRLVLNDKKAEEYRKDFYEIDKNIDIINFTELYYHNWYRSIIDWKKIKKYNTIRITSNKKTQDRANWILYYFYQTKNKILNFTWYKKNGKLVQGIFFDIYKYSHPKTIAFFIKEEYVDEYIKIIEQNFTFPIIIKENKSSKGKWIKMINNRSESINYIKNNIWEIIIVQEKVDNDWDFRIFVVNNTVPLWFKRYNPRDFRSNLSLWWSYEVFQIPDNIKEACIKINKDFWLDFSWIDLFIYKWEFKIIEINTLPWYKLRIKEELWFNLLKEIFDKNQGKL